MPQPAQRLLDLVGPGPISGPGALTVFINAIPASLTGDTIIPHGEPPHTTAVTVTGSPNVFVEGRPINCVGITAASCAHVGITGSPNTFVN